MTSLDGLVKALSDCLEADATDEALIARPFEIASLETGQQPQLALGVAATLMAGALLRLGRHGEVTPLFIRLNDELSPPGRKGEGCWRLLNPFHFLHAPLIDAALALQDQTLAVSLLTEVSRSCPGQSQSPIPSCHSFWCTQRRQAMARFTSMSLGCSTGMSMLWVSGHWIIDL